MDRVTVSLDEEADRTEPDLDAYADALLLIDALERHDLDSLTALETEALVNLYTLCSDVQRNADTLRKEIADVLLNRLHHDQPISGPFGSVQRTSRRNKSDVYEIDESEYLRKAEVNEQQKETRLQGLIVFVVVVFMTSVYISVFHAV